jgi:molybdate transport system substrate-binding protein
MRESKVLGIAGILLCAIVTMAQAAPPNSSAKSPTSGARSNAGELKIAATSDLAPALEAIIVEFKKSQGGNVKVTYGASGTLTTQIEKGAAFDVFMSADESYSKQLIAKKLADPKTLTMYSRGRLVLYVLPSIQQDITHEGLKALTNPAITKIAIANPDQDPYGRATVAAMKKAGIYDQVQSKLETAENVGQAALLIKNGKAQAGVVALTAMNDKDFRRHGRVSEVDMEAYPALDEAAVVTKHGQSNPLARVFVQYLRGQMAQGLFVRYGFMPPSNYKDVGGPDQPKKGAGEKSKGSKKSVAPKSPTTNDSQAPMTTTPK